MGCCSFSYVCLMHAFSVCAAVWVETLLFGACFLCSGALF